MDMNLINKEIFEIIAKAFPPQDTASVAVRDQWVADLRKQLRNVGVKASDEDLDLTVSYTLSYIINTAYSIYRIIDDEKNESLTEAHLVIFVALVLRDILGGWAESASMRIKNKES